MRNARFLLAAVVLAIGRPAGVGSERTGVDETVAPEATASASVTDPGASAAAVEPVGGGVALRCGRRVLTGTAEWMPALDAIADVLAASPDAEHLLAAALLTLAADPAHGSELLARAWNAMPGHPLIAINRLDACTAYPELSACVTGDVEAEVIRVDGSNGAVWARIAAKRYRNGDEPGAREALHRATTAPRYDVYWIDHVRVFERGLAASTRLSYSERALAAIGMAAAMTPPGFGSAKACLDEVGLSPEWRTACADFARRLEADGETLDLVSVGLALQEALYAATGEKQDFTVASRKRQAIDDSITAQYRAGAEAFLFSDDRLLSDYLAEFDVHGELAAVRFLQEEVTRLRAQPGYDPCD